MVPALLALAAVAVAGLGWWGHRRRSATMHRPTVDPFTMSDPWRRHLQGALAVQRRYQDIVRGTAAGPIRDRLAEIGRQVEQAVAECADVGRRGDELDDALRMLDVGALDRQLQRATDDATRQSIGAQLAAAGRLRTTRDDTDSQLRLQVTRMGELTALAAEVGVGLSATEALGSGVKDVVTQLEGLRQALQEVQQPGRPSTAT